VKPAIYKTDQKKPGRWKRVLLWGAVALVVVCLAGGGGFYLWFRAQVGAANERVDPDILQALQEEPSSTTELSTTTSTSPPTSSTSPSTSGGASTTVSTAPVTTTSLSTTTTVAPPETPSGMNILVIGSDSRSSQARGGRSDTMMLVHVDPQKNYLSVLSIPRDMFVEIPGHYAGRINASYNLGGPALLIRTIKSVMGVKINHYVEIDFNAFKALTDTLGGVYVDIDRNYNDGAIVFEPGYQLLDGRNALRYVRHRHDQNIDFGRMERQQRFLTAVREQAMGWNLPLKLPGLIKALMSNIDTDLKANDILKLAYWGVKMDGSRIRMTKLTGPGQMVGNAAVLMISPEKVASTIRTWLSAPAATTQTASSGAQELPAPPTLSEVSLTGVSVDVQNATGHLGQGALAATWLLRQGARVATVSEATKATKGAAVVTYPSGHADQAKAVALALGIPATKPGSGGRIRVVLNNSYAIDGEKLLAPRYNGSAGAPIFDKDAWRKLAGVTGLSLVAPTFVPSNYRYSFQRAYFIKTGEKSPMAVRVGYRFAREDLYLGLSETTWVDAPIASPGIKIKGPGGIIFTAVGTSTKTDHVWWVEDGVLRWISNTLFFDAQREEMLAMAMSAVPVTTTELPTTTTSAPATTEAPATTIP
jgi:polyisoprenyl-teichoic acid--peptidoglycan teichoic acid transferase